MMGGSVQIGGPTPTVMLQANDGGLDLVIVSGCAGIDANNKTDGLMVRKGANITKAADCIGKKIGVPGLNAYYHVLVRKWLNDNGVDWRRVNFVEVAFTQSADLLRSGSIDAVATGEPFTQRIVADGIGTLLVAGSTIAHRPARRTCSTRPRGTGLQANPAAVQGFRQGIIDAIANSRPPTPRGPASAPANSSNCRPRSWPPLRCPSCNPPSPQHRWPSGSTSWRSRT